MKKLIFLFIATLVLATITFAGNSGLYSTVSNSVLRTSTTADADVFYVANEGTNTLYVAAGEWIVDTNFTAYPSLAPSTAMTIQKPRFTTATFFCNTNGSATTVRADFIGGQLK